MDKKDLIELMKEEGCIEFGDFILASGKKSNYYIDVKKLITNPKALKLFSEIIKPRGEKLAGIELGAVPILVALALKTGKEFVIVRKREKGHGIKKRFEGKIENKTFTVIEDVSTTGGSILETIDVIRKNGGKVLEVITVVDREEGAKENIEKLGIEFKPLILVSELF